MLAEGLPAEVQGNDKVVEVYVARPPGTPIPPELFELFPVLKQMLGRRGGRWCWSSSAATSLPNRPTAAW